MSAYDPSNIFARILRGELPAYRVHEDDATLAFLDIMPRAAGHALVIPKAPARNLLDVAPGDLAAVMAVAQRIARAQMSVFEAEGITLTQHNEKAGGQEVFHLHVHVIPRHAGVELRAPLSYKEAPEVLAAQAERLKAALAG
ncbi:HIT family protein [Ancylobacter terrae]|uniref:HIT family protein n=1 Tax=Ancylobacter sp. sgz301288 TaxID=3342077 RepID=UPI00385C3D38